MKKIWMSVLVLSLSAGLGACNATKETLGLSKKAPNEFMVGTRAPLSMPPEYNLLPVAQDSFKTETQEAKKVETAEMTPAEKKLLAKMER